MEEGVRKNAVKDYEKQKRDFEVEKMMKEEEKKKSSFSLKHIAMLALGTVGTFIPQLLHFFWK